MRSDSTARTRSGILPSGAALADRKTGDLRIGGVCAEEDATHGIIAHASVFRSQSAFYDRGSDVITHSLDDALFRHIYARRPTRTVGDHSAVIDTGMHENSVTGFKQLICSGGVDGQERSLLRSWIAVRGVGGPVVHVPHISAKQTLRRQQNPSDKDACANCSFCHMLSF